MGAINGILMGVYAVVHTGKTGSGKGKQKYFQGWPNLPFSHLISPSVIDSAKAGQLTILTSSPANTIMLQ